MRNRALSARLFSIVVLGAFAAGCSGGGGAGGASVQPPPASRAQAELVAQSVNVSAAGDVAPGDSAPDTGTLLPLQDLTARQTSSLNPNAVTGCSSTVACIGGTNSSTGPGVSGVSALGKGVTGTTTFASTTSTNGQFGVYGQDSSASGTFDVGVYGLSARGVGTSGKSTSNYGVRGTSANSYGVFGVSTNNIGIFGSGPKRGIWGSGGTIGVYGNGTSQGVYGSSTSSSGTAVYGNSTNYIGVYGLSGAYIGVFGSGKLYGSYGSSSGGTGGFFISGSSYGAYGSSGSGSAVYGSSSTGFAFQGHTGGSVGVYVTNSNGNGGDVTGSYIGIVGRAPTTGFPIVATDSAGNNLFYVTGTGDVYYHGGIHSFSTISRGAQAMAFSPQATRPSIEDTGTARLIAGRAVVTLDSTFARAIDTQRPYQVFLTPGGDTRGLYVASKSPSSFVVREVQGGHASFSFDYHVYGTALGKAAEHMMVVQPNAKPLHYSEPSKTRPQPTLPRPPEE